MIATELFFMGLLDIRSRSREGYQSIFHYWESEKYRGVDEQVRQDILNIPTIRELQKLLRRLPESWRSDWKLVRGRVFRSALIYAHAAHPDMHRELMEPFELVEACRKWGIPDGFVKTELAAARHEIEEPFRLLAIGSEAAPANHVQATLERLISKRQDCQYVAFAGRKMDTGLHQWAAERLYPIHYVGTNSKKGLDQNAVQQLLPRSTHVVIFTREGTAADEQIVAAARAEGCKIRVSQYSVARPAAKSPAANSRAGSTADATGRTGTARGRALRVV
jgi:hypothetical protein